VGAIALGTGEYGANSRVTVPYTNFSNQDPGVHILDCFTLPTYAEAEYSPTGPLAAAISLPAADIAATPLHGGVAYEDVPDTANNSDLGFGVQSGPDVGANIWHGFSASPVTGSWDDTDLGLTLPLFAVADLLGPFEIVAAYNSAPCQGLAANPATTLSFTCEFLFTQPVFFGVPSVTPAAANEDFDGVNAYNDQASINDVHSAAAATTKGDMAYYCAQKFELWSAGTPPTPDAAPDYCVPLNAAGTIINSAGGVYTPAALAQAYGFEVYWGSVTPLVAGTDVTGDFVTFSDNGTAATDNNFFAADMSTIASAFYAGAYSISGDYTTEGYGPGGFTPNGIVVANNHNSPDNLLFEQSETVSP
jgi:hypothetical protein